MENKEQKYFLFDEDCFMSVESLTREEVLNYLKSHAEEGGSLNNIYIVETQYVKKPFATFSF